MSMSYYVGLYALVHRQGTYLMVRQVASTLPPAPYGLPGAVLMGELGVDVAELHLRRKLLSQMGMSVTALTLSGSHTLRTSDGGVVLNLIFGTDYNSGVPNPQPDVIQDMKWYSLAELQGRPDVPDWLLTTVRAYQDHLSANTPAPPPARTGLLRRGR